MYKSQKIYFEGTGGLKDTINKDTAITVKRVKKRKKKQQTKKRIKRPNQDVVDKLKGYKGKDNILLEILRLVLKQGETKKQTKAEPVFKPPKKSRKMKQVLPTRAQVDKQRNLEKKARAAELIKQAADKKARGQYFGQEIGDAEKLIEQMKNEKRQRDKEYFESFKGIDVDFFMKQAEYSRMLVDEELEKQRKEAERLRAAPPPPIATQGPPQAGPLQPAPQQLPPAQIGQAVPDKLEKINKSDLLSDDARFWLMANTEVQRFSKKSIDNMMDYIEQIIQSKGLDTVNKDELPQLLLFETGIQGGKGYKKTELKPIGKSLFAEYKLLEPETSDEEGSEVGLPQQPALKIPQAKYRKKGDLSFGNRKNFTGAFKELTGIDIPANEQAQKSMGFSDEDIAKIRKLRMKYQGMGDTGDITNQALNEMEDLAFKYFPGEYNTVRLQAGLETIEASPPEDTRSSVAGTESYFSPSSSAVSSASSEIPEYLDRKFRQNPIYLSNNEQIQRLRDEIGQLQSATGAFSYLLNQGKRQEDIRLKEQQIQIIMAENAKLNPSVRVEEYERLRGEYKASRKKPQKSGDPTERERLRQEGALAEEQRLNQLRGLGGERVFEEQQQQVQEQTNELDFGDTQQQPVLTAKKPKKAGKKTNPEPEPQLEGFGGGGF